MGHGNQVALNRAEYGGVSDPSDLAEMVLSAHLVTDDFEKISDAVGGAEGLKVYVFGRGGPVVLEAEDGHIRNALIDIAFR